MGHVGLEAERLRAVDHLQQFEHAPPTMHAAPADFALRGEPLAVVLGDLACLAERLGDALLVALGIFAPWLTPQAESIRTTPLGRMPNSRSRWPMRQALFTCAKNFSRSTLPPIGESAARAGIDRATTEPTSRFLARVSRPACDKG